MAVAGEETEKSGDGRRRRRRRRRRRQPHRLSGFLPALARATHSHRVVKSSRSLKIPNILVQT